jgi:thiol:disulfide interchange protein DsbD
MGLFAALLFAWAGGLLLNLMPCVFPVLGIKIMSFARHAQSDPVLMRKQGFAFLFGVLVSFWILAGILIALRSAGESIGWGFQLQSPLFVTLLAMLFMLMALNLSGVFEMGLRLQTAAGELNSQGHSTLIDAFFSGVLATIVATPCTAPMMGAALGFTLSQPAFLSLLVFTAIAIGMALPVLTLSLVPQWLRFLPKPGAWMDTFKQFLAFPLYATVAWLAWVLGSQIGNDGAAKLLFGLVIIALAAWLYGHWQVFRPLRAILVAIIVALCGLAIAWPIASGTGGTRARIDDGWVPFSTQKIAELRRQHKAVFVDFTATWCITCQVNKRVALNQKDVVMRFKELDIVRMKADWTVKDPEITGALAAFGRNGVPLYVFYPVDGEPRTLPEILTPAIVLSEIEPVFTPVANH